MKRREFSRLAGLTTLGASAGLGPMQLSTAMSGSARVERVDRAHRTEWAKEHFKGFENILLPSFTPDLKELDEMGIRLDTRQSIKHGFFSTLCETTSLSIPELKRFLEIVVDEAQGKISVAFPIHSMTEEQIFEMLEYGDKVGCSHVLLDMPTQGNQEELYNWTIKFARATNLGIYLWWATKNNFGRFHPSQIPYQLYDRLADEPNIVALKCGAGPDTLFELFERYNDRMLIGALRMQIMPMTIKLYGQQWSGAWTVERLQTPDKPYAVDFFNLMMKGKYDRGMEIYWQHLHPSFQAMMRNMASSSSRVAQGAHAWDLMKYQQFLSGGNGGRMRPDPHFPDLPEVTEEFMQGAREDFRAIGLEPTDTPDEAFFTGRTFYNP